MKTTSAITAFGLLALAAAAPADVVRRQDATPTTYSAPLGTGASASPYASSFGTASAYYPTGTAPTYPIGSGTSCSKNGELVCSEDGKQFGTCNWGKVIFQPVAEGTKCEDGKIGFSDEYAGAAAVAGVFPSGAAVPTGA